MIRTWKDVVFLDGVGVEGKTLNEALAYWADETEAHDIADDICTCVYCQTFTPMAHHLQRELTAATERASGLERAIREAYALIPDCEGGAMGAVCRILRGALGEGAQ